MPQATCRCGHPLDFPDDGTERVVCAKCGAKVRVRRSKSQAAAELDPEGFIRFHCPCGRRLKVSGAGGMKPSHGKCPDCGRVVPVPSTSLQPIDPESPTEELSVADSEMLAAWSKRHLDKQRGRSASAASTEEHPAGATPWKSEAGLRVCPGCGKPVHLGATVCRGCGSAVPKR